MSSGFLSVSGAAKTFGAATVLDGVDLAMSRGEFVSLLGPFGCGKTTLLRIVAGLIAPDQGKVALDGAAPEDGQILIEAPTLPAGAGPGARLKLSWDVDDTLVYPAPDAAS